MIGINMPNGEEVPIIPGVHPLLEHKEPRMVKKPEEALEESVLIRCPVHEALGEAVHGRRDVRSRSSCNPDEPPHMLRRRFRHYPRLLVEIDRGSELMDVFNRKQY